MQPEKKLGTNLYHYTYSTLHHFRNYRINLTKIECNYLAQLQVISPQTSLYKEYLFYKSNICVAFLMKQVH